MSRAIAYLRVSTLDQNLKKKADILHLANEKDLGRVEFIKEKVSGNVPWRQRKIGPLLTSMKRGHVILLSEFSRWAAACSSASRSFRWLWIKEYESIRSRAALFDVQVG